MHTLIAAIGFVLIHIYAGKLLFLTAVPRKKWLSAGGGISVAYVFIHIFPMLNKNQEEFKKEFDNDSSLLLSYIEHHIYLIALAGFVAFYLLERFVKVSGSSERSAEKTIEPSSQIFRIHMISFAFYNALIGYLLIRGENNNNPKELFFYFIALGLHLIINDFGLRQHHPKKYHRRGRWILGFAVLGGWLTGVFISLPPYVTNVLFALLAGSIILNVMKEELPDDRYSSAPAFFIGSLISALILLAL